MFLKIFLWRFRVAGTGSPPPPPPLPAPPTVPLMFEHDIQLAFLTFLQTICYILALKLWDGVLDDPYFMFTIVIFTLLGQ